MINDASERRNKQFNSIHKYILAYYFFLLLTWKQKCFDSSGKYSRYQQ